MKIDITLKRNYLSDCVQGVMELECGWRCMTIERPDLGNKQSISCIPEGVYEYFFRKSPTNGDVLELRNVVNRTHIQIHIGNWVKNSVGCILVGRTFKLDPGKEPMVTSSTPTMEELLEKAPSEGIIKITS